MRRQGPPESENNTHWAGPEEPRLQLVSSLQKKCPGQLQPRGLVLYAGSGNCPGEEEAFDLEYAASRVHRAGRRPS